MMKLSRTASYAVQAALHLAQSKTDSPVPCSRIAADGQMPERFLLQVLRTLVTKEILHSTRGVDGGYMLEREPGDISLLEVIEAIDGPMAAKLPPVDGLSTDTKDKLIKAMDGVTAHMRRELNAIKLTDLLALKPKPTNGKS